MSGGSTAPSRYPLPVVRLASVLTALAVFACGDDGSRAPDAGPPVAVDAALDAGAPDAGPAEAPEDLDGFIEFHMARGGIPGLAATLLVDGEPAWTGVYGYANVETEAPVTEDTIFGVGSISKTVVTAVLLQLLAAGALGVHDAVDDHLPFAFRHPEHPDEPLTLEMLATHTSGLHETFARLLALGVEGDPTVPLSELAEGYVTPGGRYYDDQNFASRPGTTHDYCNVGFAVLAHVTEVVGGEDFRARSRRTVFEPVGMSSTGWFLEELPAERLARGHSFAERTGRYSVQPLGGSVAYPAGNLRASVVDVGRFVQMLLAGGLVDGERVIDEALLEAALAPRVPWTDHDEQGLGFRRIPIGGRLWWGHDGSTAESSSVMGFSRSEGSGVVILTNSDLFIRQTIGLGTAGIEALRAISQRLVTELGTL